MHDAKLFNAGKAGDKYVFRFIYADGSTVALAFSREELARLQATASELINAKPKLHQDEP